MKIKENDYVILTLHTGAHRIVQLKGGPKRYFQEKKDNQQK